MFRTWVNAVCASLVISIFVGAEAGTIPSSEYLPPADGNYQTYSVDGASSLTLTVVRDATLIIMPRR